MMLGDMAISEGKFEEAAAIWKNIEAQDAQYLPLVAERLLNAYRSLDREADGVALLRDYLSKYHSLDLMNVVFDGVLKRRAGRRLSIGARRVAAQPTLLGLDKLLEARRHWKCRWAARRCRAGERPESTQTHAQRPCTTAPIAASRRASSAGTARPAGAWDSYSPRQQKKPEPLFKYKN
jgi:hypothetical protein